MAQNEQGLTYFKFTQLVRHLIAEANPSAAHTKINALLGALWSDYKKKKGTGAVTPNVPSPKSSAGEAKKQKNPPKASKSTKSKLGVGTLHFVCRKKG